MLAFRIDKIKEKLRRGLKLLILSSGVMFLLMLVLSFTTLPYWGMYSLAIHKSNFDFEPDVIVVMGGAGMPSQTALIRTYHAAQLAKTYTSSSFIIALPDNLNDSTSHLQKMKQELIIRGVRSQIMFEPEGTNTRSQALLIKEMLKDKIDQNLIIVSSPEHIYRAVKSFEKVGFDKVAGYPAFERDIEESLSFNSKKLGGKEFLPDVGESSQLRYQFWNHLKYEIILLREYSAIVYYKIQSWI